MPATDDIRRARPEFFVGEPRYRGAVQRLIEVVGQEDDDVEPFEVGFGDIHHVFADKGNVGREVIAEPGEIGNGDLVTARSESRSQDRTDVTGAAGDEDLHECSYSPFRKASASGRVSHSASD